MFKRGIDPKEAMGIGLTSNSIHITNNAKINVLHRIHLGNLTSYELRYPVEVKNLLELLSDMPQESIISNVNLYGKPSEIQFDGFSKIIGEEKASLFHYEINTEFSDMIIPIRFNEKIYPIKGRITQSIWIL